MWNEALPFIKEVIPSLCETDTQNVSAPVVNMVCLTKPCLDNLH